MKLLSAADVAQQLFNAGLEGEDLFSAMWDSHDQLGLEPRDIFEHYKNLKATTPAAA